MDRPFARYDLFQWLPEEARAAFNRAAKTRRYSIGTLLYQEGDLGNGLYRILSGTVRLFVARASGSEVIYTFYEAGDCFGDSSCIDSQPRSQAAEVATDAEIQLLDPLSFDRFRQEHGAFNEALLQLVTRQIRLLSIFNADSHLSDLRSRVARRILDRVSALACDEAHALTIGLSQTQLALMVGASRQSVNKVLQKFQAEGLLRIDYGSLVILNLQRLAEQARHDR